MLQIVSRGQMVVLIGCMDYIPNGNFPVEEEHLRYIQRNARLPKNPSLLRTLDEAAGLLEEHLGPLDVDLLPITDYNKNYLGKYQKNMRGNLMNAVFLLAWAIDGTGKPLAEISLLDHGGGFGLLSLLAKQAGVGQVLYSDIYDGSCRDARMIGRELGLEADEYLHGEMEELISQVRERQLPCDAIISNNVIEHVYDYQKLFRQLPGLTDGPLVVAMQTTANPENPVVLKRHRQIHHCREYEGLEPEYGQKETEMLRAYREVRRGIILEVASDLPKEAVGQLVDRTRGLAEAEIREAVTVYREKNILPQIPNHPSNTCDPRSGNWAERLVAPSEMEHVLRNEGFEVRAMPGYYSCAQSQLKRMICSGVNLTIAMLGPLGRKLSPTFMLYGIRK